MVLGGGGCGGGWLGVFRIEGTSTEAVTTLGNCGKSGNWRQYPPTELRGIAQLDGRRRGKKVDSVADGPSPGGRV